MFKVRHKHSEETKRKISEVHSGEVKSEAHKKALSLSLKEKGIKPIAPFRWTGLKRPIRSEEWKRKISANQQNVTLENWSGYSNSVNHRIRHSKEYIEWRITIFKRDDYRCYDCGERGRKLHVHHIYPFSLFPRIRLQVENGVTLCIECHRKTKTWGRNLFKDSIEGKLSLPTYLHGK